MKHWHKLLFISGAVLLSPQAQAHINSLSTGLLAGIIHPLSGADHFLALMLAGLLSGRLIHGRYLALFGLLLALGLGAGAGILLGAQAWTEGAILLSVPVFFALQWIKQDGHMKAAMIIMSLFMIAHGWAHGVEMGDMDKSFILGFLLTSATVMGLFSLLGAALKSRFAHA